MRVRVSRVHIIWTLCTLFEIAKMSVGNFGIREIAIYIIHSPSSEPFFYGRNFFTSVITQMIAALVNHLF